MKSNDMIKYVETDFGRVKLPVALSWSFLQKHMKIQKLFFKVINSYAEFRYRHYWN